MQTKITVLSASKFLQKSLIAQTSEVKDFLSNQTGPYLQWFDDHCPFDKLNSHFTKDLKNGKPTITKAFCNFTGGMVILAGKPNHSKSTISVSLANHLLQDKDTIVVDISLDDGIKDRYVQYICNMTGLKFGEVNTFTQLNTNRRAIYENAHKQLQTYQESNLYILPSSLDIEMDGVKGNLDFSLNSSILQFMDYLRKEYPKKKIVIFLDALHDVTFDGTTWSELDSYKKTVSSLSKKAVDLQINLFATCHVRKSEGRIKIEDLMGSKSLEYAAKAILLVTHCGIEATERDREPILYREDGDLHNIITIQIPKNKASGLKADLIYALDDTCCQLRPIAVEHYQELSKDIYQLFSNKK